MAVTAQKMKFCIKDFVSKCDEVRSLLSISSHLLKKSLMGNFIFLCSASKLYVLLYFQVSFTDFEHFCTNSRVCLISTFLNINKEHSDFFIKNRDFGFRQKRKKKKSKILPAAVTSTQRPLTLAL